MNQKIAAKPYVPKFKRIKSSLKAWEVIGNINVHAVEGAASEKLLENKEKYRKYHKQAYAELEKHTNDFLEFAE